MVKRLTTVTLLLSLALVLAGFSCNHRAAQSSLGVAASIEALQNGEIVLHQQGKVTDSEHKVLQQGFLTLAQADIDARKCIAQTDAPTCLDSAISAVNDFSASPAVMGIKNPDSQTQVKAWAAAITTALTILKGAL